MNLADEYMRGETITLGDLARDVGVSVVTAGRWRTVGLPSSDGRRVRLECARLGRYWRTSRRCYREMIERLAAKSEGVLCA